MRCRRSMQVRMIPQEEGSPTACAVTSPKGHSTAPFRTDPSAPRLDGSSHRCSDSFGCTLSVGRSNRNSGKSFQGRIIVNGQTNYRCEKKTSEIGFRGKEHQKISDP